MTIFPPIGNLTPVYPILSCLKFFFFENHFENSQYYQIKGFKVVQKLFTFFNLVAPFSHNLTLKYHKTHKKNLKNAPAVTVLNESSTNRQSVLKKKSASEIFTHFQLLITTSWQYFVKYFFA
jgi:hypothetical protein